MACLINTLSCFLSQKARALICSKAPVSTMNVAFVITLWDLHLGEGSIVISVFIFETLFRNLKFTHIFNLIKIHFFTVNGFYFFEKKFLSRRGEIENVSIAEQMGVL